MDVTRLCYVTMFTLVLVFYSRLAMAVEKQPSKEELELEACASWVGGSCTLRSLLEHALIAKTVRYAQLKESHHSKCPLRKGAWIISGELQKRTSIRTETVSLGVSRECFPNHPDMISVPVMDIRCVDDKEEPMLGDEKGHYRQLLAIAESIAKHSASPPDRESLADIRRLRIKPITNDRDDFTVRDFIEKGVAKPGRWVWATFKPRKGQLGMYVREFQGWSFFTKGVFSNEDEELAFVFRTSCSDGRVAAHMDVIHVGGQYVLSIGPEFSRLIERAQGK